MSHLRWSFISACLSDFFSSRQYILFRLIVVLLMSRTSFIHDDISQKYINLLSSSIMWTHHERLQHLMISAWSLKNGVITSVRSEPWVCLPDPPSCLSAWCRAPDKHLSVPALSVCQAGRPRREPACMYVFCVCVCLCLWVRVNVCLSVLKVVSGYTP